MKLGYKPSYISSCLEQYENAYGTKRYDFKEIKAMIDRMAKPESGPAKRVSSADSMDSSADSKSVLYSDYSSLFVSDISTFSSPSSLHHNIS